MTKSEIKQVIHSQLDTTEDDTLLEVVYDILQNGLPIPQSLLSNESFNASIDRGLSELKSGKLMNNEDANREIDEWLNQ